MLSKLLVRLPSLLEKTQEVDWLILDPDSKVVEEGRGLLNDIPRQFAEGWVTVLAPSSEILMLEVLMPNVKQAQLRKIIPFAIEDYLTRDLSDLHVAIGGVNEDGLRVVAVAEHARMKDWLGMLKEAGLHADVMIPDFWYFPWKEGVWSVWLEPEFAFVKIGKHQNFVADIANLGFLINLRYQELEQEQKTLPVKLEVMASNGDLLAKWLPEAQKEMGLPVEGKPVSSSFLSMIGQHLPEKKKFTLLQSPYEVKKKSGKLKKQWFPVFLLFAAWVFFFLFAHVFEYFYLRHQNVVLDRQMLSRYQQLFPSVQDLEVSRQRLETWVARTVKVARGDLFLRKLAQIAPLIKSASVELTGFDYRDSEWLLRIQSSDFQALNLLMQSFKSKGIHFVKKSALQKGNKVISELVVK